MTDTETRPAKKTTAKKTTTTEPKPPPGPAITPPQLRLLAVLMHEQHLTDRTEALAFCSGLAGRTIDSRAHLTMDEAGGIIDVLQAMEPPRPPTVHEAIAAVKRDLPAVRKMGRNEEQGYVFRSIDDLVNAISPILAKHGVYYLPIANEMRMTDRPTRSGGTMALAILEVSYRIYGPGGDYVEATTWGEGADTSDKSINKAHTGAYKTMLAQVFAIAFDLADSDHSSPDTTGPSNTELLERLDGYARQQNISRSEITAKWRAANGNLPVEALDTMPPDRLYPLVRSIGAWIEKQEQEAREAERQAAAAAQDAQPTS